MMKLRWKIANKYHKLAERRPMKLLEKGISKRDNKLIRKAEDKIRKISERAYRIMGNK